MLIKISIYFVHLPGAGANALFLTTTVGAQGHLTQVSLDPPVNVARSAIKCHSIR